MSGINLHQLLGNIGKIETRFTPSGAPVVSMSIATSEKWKDKNTGQIQEKTDWNNVVVFGKPAEIIGEYAQKGDKIYVSGKVVTRKYQDSNGQDRYVTETVVDGFNGRFELLGSKRDQSSQSNQQNNQPNNGQQTQNQQGQAFQQQSNQNQGQQMQSNQQNNNQQFSQSNASNQQFIDQNQSNMIDDDDIPF